MGILQRLVRAVLGLQRPAGEPAGSSPAESPAPPSASTGPKPPPPPFEEKWGYLGAVGESQYQPTLKRAARQSRLCWACLVPEPDNPFDANAVAVKIQGETVGYLCRADARRYQRRLLALTTAMEVPAKLIGGTFDKPSFGVLLDCRKVEALPKPKPPRRKKLVADPSDQPF
jgi:hypothetical protein